MNFLAHFQIATQFLAPPEPLSAYVLGMALPDLLPLAERRVRLRPAQIAEAETQTEFEAALSAGVLVHLATDAAFHKTPAFAQAQAEVSRLLAEAAFEGIRVRRFFVAHVLTEMVLDAVLLRADPAIADHFYEAFAGADFAGAAAWTETVTGKALPRLPATLTRFARSQYLRQYAGDDGVAAGLSQICGRARQDTFDGENLARLVGVVGPVAAVLTPFVPALLGETAAGIQAAGGEHSRYLKEAKRT